MLYTYIPIYIAPLVSDGPWLIVREIAALSVSVTGNRQRTRTQKSVVVCELYIQNDRNVTFLPIHCAIKLSPPLTQCNILNTLYIFVFGKFCGLRRLICHQPDDISARAITSLPLLGSFFYFSFSPYSTPPSRKQRVVRDNGTRRSLSI